MSESTNINIGISVRHLKNEMKYITDTFLELHIKQSLIFDEITKNQLKLVETTNCEELGIHTDRQNLLQCFCSNEQKEDSSEKLPVASSSNKTQRRWSRRAQSFGGFDNKLSSNDLHRFFPKNRGNSSNKLYLDDLSITSEEELYNNIGNSKYFGLFRPSTNCLLSFDQKNAVKYVYTLGGVICKQTKTIKRLENELCDLKINKLTQNEVSLLEEIRNLHDQITKEKEEWLKEKERREKELFNKRQFILEIETKNKSQQEDNFKQRQQLNFKLDWYTKRGLIAKEKREETQGPFSRQYSSRSYKSSKFGRNNRTTRSTNMPPMVPIRRFNSEIGNNVDDEQEVIV